MTPRKIIPPGILSVIVTAFVVVACNRRLTTTYYNINTLGMTTPLKFAIITDLHSTEYGEKMEELFKHQLINVQK